MYGTQVYICGFAGGRTGKSDCGMVSPPAWIFAPYYYGLKTHRGRHFPKRRPRLDEPGRARRGCDRKRTLSKQNPPTEFCRGRFRFRLCMRMTTSSLWINPLIRRFIRRLEIMKIRWQTALHGILNRKVNPSSTAVSTASTATPPALSCSPSTP